MATYDRAESVKSAKKKMRATKANILIREPLFEWAENQKSILGVMNDPKTNAVIIDGLAGSGKTTLAVYSALQHLQKGLVEKVVYVRTAVEASHSKLGYLKGSLEDKFGPYAEVMQEKLKDFLNLQEIQELTQAGKLETIPISFLRGRDLKNSIVIGDEMQNAYLSEIITLSTRISDNSKLFLLADGDQCDLPKQAQDEFATFVRLFNTQDAVDNNIFYFEMKDEMDVKRSPFVKFVSKTYRNFKKATNK